MNSSTSFQLRSAWIPPAVAHAPIVISAREPYDAALFGAAESIACIYGDQAVSFEGLAELMAARVR